MFSLSLQHGYNLPYKTTAKNRPLPAPEKLSSTTEGGFLAKTLTLLKSENNNPLYIHIISNLYYATLPKHGYTYFKCLLHIFTHSTIF